MNLVRFHEWSRRPKGATTASHPIGSTKGVTFHWEGPHMGSFPHSECPSKVRGIQAFHRDGRGWSEIAYSALVCPHGYVFEGRGPNVASAANGYATANQSHYAVCYLGGERDPLTDDGKQAFRDAVAWLRAEGNAGPEINGHRDHKATACPGDQIYTWLKSGDAEPLDATEEPTMKPRDIFRYRLRKDGTTFADILRRLDKLATDVAAIRANLEQQDDTETPAPKS